MAVDPYSALLKQFSRRAVRCAVIGVSGINYYADDPGHMFSTQDFDILVDAAPANLPRALRTMEEHGYALESNGEPLGPVDRWLVQKILERQAVISGMKSEVGRVDLVLEAGGMPFKAWKKEARRFRVGGVAIIVGGLSSLLRAKELAGRDKDKKFLSLYRIHLAEMVEKAALWTRRRK